MSKINLENTNQVSETIKRSMTSVSNFLGQKQSEFLNSNIGKAVNMGIDVGLRHVLPDFLEDEIIDIKDALLSDGISSAVNTAIDSAIDFGKSAIGIVTGNFENISQVKNAIDTGGLIDTLSGILDKGIDLLKNKGYIDKKTSTAIKKGKNKILGEVEKSVEKSFDDQIEIIEKIDGYIEKWQQYYNEENFTNMEYQYKKIQENLEKVMPLEETLIKARQVENLHELIKNKGKDFNLTNEEKELVKMLVN